jgi:uncharacterized membrane protein SpoIIM required for sporulation
MKAEEFVASRQASWKTLADLLTTAERSMGHLSPEEITRLGQLYRAATSDLAYAQREFPRNRAATYLNQLVGRGHAVIYRSEPLAFRRIWYFIRAGFPRAFREMLPFFLISSALFFIPAVLIGVAVFLRPEIAPAALPPGSEAMVEMLKEKEIWTNIPVEERPFMSSYIMTNNIRVAILAFGGGMLAGLLTLWVLIQNGLMLGAISGVAFHYGMGWELWEFVIGHGVIELSVIAIAGGTGLMIGWAILHPGLLRRTDALAAAGRRTVKVMCGCVPLLVIAGTIEGFISPNEFIPAPVKWAVGIGTGILLYAYLLLAGRGEDTAEEGTE